MEVRALFDRFVWPGVNIDDVTIRPSRGSSINPTLKVCEHNRVAHASLLRCSGTPKGVTRLDDARGKKQVWRPHVRTWHFSEPNVL